MMRMKGEQNSKLQSMELRVLDDDYDDDIS